MARHGDWDRVRPGTRGGIFGQTVQYQHVYSTVNSRGVRCGQGLARIANACLSSSAEIGTAGAIGLEGSVFSQLPPDTRDSGTIQRKTCDASIDTGFTVSALVSRPAGVYAFLPWSCLCYSLRHSYPVMASSVGAPPSSCLTVLWAYANADAHGVSPQPKVPSCGAPTQ